jgi:hypothetical protein
MMHRKIFTGFWHIFVQYGSGESKKNYTTVLEFSAGTYEEEGDFLLQAKVPTRVEIYETAVRN